MREPLAHPGVRPKPEPIPWSRPGVLVGVDGSDESVEALRVAADMGPRLGLPVHALAVWDYPILLYPQPYFGEIVENSRELSQQVLADAVERVLGESRPAWFTSAIQQGNPARCLIERSPEAAVVAVGSRGHGGFSGLLIGSVSAALTSHAHCSVLVVRGPFTLDGEVKR